MYGAYSDVEYVHHEWVRVCLAELIALLVLHYCTTLPLVDGRRLVHRLDGNMARGVAMPSRLVVVGLVAGA